MAKIDITMTATLRPKIVIQTLKSISENIITDQYEFRLIINIDPIGEAGIQPKTILKIAKTYIKKENIIFNFAKKPSFPKAVIWVWKNSSAPYIFHIEDDWSINRKVDVSKMIEILDKHKELSSLRLYKYKAPNKKVFSTFLCKWRYNDEGFYIADKWQKQFGLNPILIKRQFIDEALPNMREDVNPEKQFRDTQPYMVPVIKKWKYAIFSKPNQKTIMTDIGLDWRKRNKFTKPKKKSFLVWEKE